MACFKLHGQKMARAWSECTWTMSSAASKKDNKFEGLCFKENRASGDDDGDDGNDDDDDDNVIVDVSFPSLIRLKNLLAETRHCDKEA